MPASRPSGGIHLSRPGPGLRGALLPASGKPAVRAPCRTGLQRRQSLSRGPAVARDSGTHRRPAKASDHGRCGAEFRAGGDSVGSASTGTASSSAEGAPGDVDWRTGPKPAARVTVDRRAPGDAWCVAAPAWAEGRIKLRPGQPDDLVASSCSVAGPESPPALIQSLETAVPLRPLALPEASGSADAEDSTQAAAGRKQIAAHYDSGNDLFTVPG